MWKAEYERYALECNEELKNLIRELAPIPAPSGKEDLRVEFLLKYFRKLGHDRVFADEAKNVILEIPAEGTDDLAVFEAHTDVVFPDLAPLPFREDEEYFYCPGVGDDTARLAMLIFAFRYFLERGRKPKIGLLFVANSCEEGLGNLKGTRQIFKTYGKRIREFLSNDGGLPTLVDRAVGSERYRVTVKTPGGHSWSAFGNANAIREAASLIDDLYRVQVPEKEDAKTTFNVGLISGGTSVNTIAENAEFLYEYRSTDRECLAFMRDTFRRITAAHEREDVKFDMELLGERPCNGDLDPAAMEALKNRVRKAAMEANGIELKTKSASTDSNIPLSLGVPAVTIGSCTSDGTHTRAEKLEIASLVPGMRYLLAILDEYFEEEDK